MGRDCVLTNQVFTLVLWMHLPRQRANLPTSLAFTPLYGRWSDIFGRKAVLIFSLSVFFISSLACALAQTMVQVCPTYSVTCEQNKNILPSLSYFEHSKALAEVVRVACPFSSMLLSAFIMIVAILTIVFIMYSYSFHNVGIKMTNLPPTA